MLAVVKTAVDEEKATFDDFWLLYPRRAGKKDAQNAFRRIHWTPELWGKVKDSIAMQKRTEQWLKEGGQFIPYPASFLRGERWDDEAEVVIEMTPCRWRGCGKAGTKSIGDIEFCETHFHARKRGESPV